ncbi:MAG: ATP-binding protein, partial [Lachnospiraceae bacterium]|nr:ATP-binding protein [Lachnospiraceae bacterium]
MFSQVTSGAIYGLEVMPIRVQADLSDGFPSYTMVGFLASEVKESRERVTTALRNRGFRMPAKRAVINLAPADLKKQGTAFDLPIAAGILCSLGIIESKKLEDVLLIGELSLDGSVLPVKGALPIARMAQREGIKSCFVPYANREEAALCKGVNVYGIKDIGEMVLHLNGKRTIEKAEADIEALLKSEKTYISSDFADIEGQTAMKRACEIAAAGGHSLMLIGAQGTGKTMAAACMPYIMPEMSLPECLEATEIASIAGLLGEDRALVTQRPFRSPHASITRAAMIGGGSIPKPGEITLAQHGILFMDELEEYH